MLWIAVFYCINTITVITPVLLFLNITLCSNFIGCAHAINVYDNPFIKCLCMYIVYSSLWAA